MYGLRKVADISIKGGRWTSHAPTPRIASQHSTAHEHMSHTLDTAALKARIATLESRIEEDKEELYALAKALKDAESARAINMALPVQDLPADVLVPIFAATLSVRCNDEYGEAHSMRTSLRLVCSQWNQVVLHEPGLWTDVFIDVMRELEAAEAIPSLEELQACFGQKRKPLTFPKAAMDGIARDIKRSKGLNRRLRLVLPSTFQWMTDLRHRPVDLGLFKFIYQSGNWESISIRFTDDIDSAGGLVPQFFRPEGVTSKLSWRMWRTVHTLDISTEFNREPEYHNENHPRYMSPRQVIPLDEHEDHEERFSASPCLKLTAEACPALRTVSLQLTGRNLLQWSLPWRQLTDLTLRTFANPFSDYGRVLRQCEALLTLEIHVDLPNRHCKIPDTRLGVHISLPRLHTLVLREDALSDMLLNLVGVIRAPSLHTFSYRNDIDEDDYRDLLSFCVIETLSALIKKSSCSIRSLSIHLSEATIHDCGRLHHFFDLVPALESLSLAGQGMTCEFLNRRILPKTLKKVHISNIYRSEIDPNPNFAEWAVKWARDERCREEEGRESQISASLSTIISPGSVWDPDRFNENRRRRVPAILKELEDQGIDVKIRYIL